MSATTSIQWTDKTWNPVRGCSVISPGCVNCYAMKQAHRFSAPGKPYAGLTRQTTAGPQWTGTIQTVESALLEPLSWRTPTRIFVNSMSDLFHEGVPFHFIDRVFGVMAVAQHHTFQILTKRADRMRLYFAEGEPVMQRWGYHAAATLHAWKGGSPESAAEAARRLEPTFPLPNVWLGISAEDQPRYDQRIGQLLRTPAAVRFLSLEPLLGPVDLRMGGNSLPEYSPHDPLPNVDWMIVGGESGPGARPCDVQWMRSIVEQCQSQHLPVFVKQLGAFPVVGNDEDCATWAPHVGKGTARRAPATWREPWPWVPTLRDRKGADPSEWPEYLRIREFPEARP